MKVTRTPVLVCFIITDRKYFLLCNFLAENFCFENYDLHEHTGSVIVTRAHRNSIRHPCPLIIDLFLCVSFYFVFVVNVCHI